MADEKFIKGIKIGDEGEVYFLESHKDPTQETEIANIKEDHNTFKSQIQAQIQDISDRLAALKQALDEYIAYDTEGDQENSSNI